MEKAPEFLGEEVTCPERMSGRRPALWRRGAVRPGAGRTLPRPRHLGHRLAQHLNMKKEAPDDGVLVDYHPHPSARRRLPSSRSSWSTIRCGFTGVERTRHPAHSRAKRESRQLACVLKFIALGPRFRGGRADQARNLRCQRFLRYICESQTKERNADGSRNNTITTTSRARSCSIRSARGRASASTCSACR